MSERSGLAQAPVAPQPPVAAARIDPAGRPTVDGHFGDDWWQRGVIYQVYPRSFADSDGDGIGDLAGLIDRLDYLNDGTDRSLLVDAIWLSPIHPSPGFDVGYDVADYDAIDPAFGSLADFDRLVEAAHRRGIRIILDLVMNHTSSAHRWFEESRRDPAGPYGDWYLWRDAKPALFGRRGRPNNWASFFGGSAWQWDESRGQYYMHTFLPEQPDLNWRNPAVRTEMLAMVRRWLERGVDGFRLDVFNAFFKHEQLLSNPRQLLGRRGYSRQRHLYDKDRPELLDFLVEFRALVDSFPGRMTVGEMFAGDVEAAARLAAPRHLVFDFLLMQQPWRAQAFARASAIHERIFTGERWPTVVLSNHDQSRHVSRFGARPAEKMAEGHAIAKAAAVLSLTLRGTPFLYYGEEIGARDVAVPWDEIIDPPAKRGGRLVRRLVPWWNRDQARSPMPWGGGPNGGFTTGRPWLRMSDDVATRNVARQADDPRSVLADYRRLIRLRREQPVLQTGASRQVAAGSRDVYAYLREEDGEAALIAINFSSRDVITRVAARPGARWKPVHDTVEPPIGEVSDDQPFVLRPHEAVVLRPA